MSQGTNRLVATDGVLPVERVLAGDWPHGRCTELWDGRTATRVIASLKRRSGV